MSGAAHTPLLPCPFCGGVRVVRCNGAVKAREYTYCRDCGAQGPKADNRYGAIEVWNTRPGPDPSVVGEAIEALRRIATVDMGGGFLGAQACRKVANEALSKLEGKA